ncbi:MAG: hypothetical protein V1746_04650 [bacterium]
MDWNIKERSETCAATGLAFKEGDLVHTLLLEEIDGLKRKDLSAQAWQTLDKNARPLSFWQSIFKPHPAALEEPVRHDDAEAELRRLLEKNNRADDKLCRLLALLLERKRILRVRERASLDGQPVIIYEHADTQETFIVRETDFKLAEVESLQKELSQAGGIFSKERAVLQSEENA